MKILICSLGSKQCEVTLRFGALVAQAFSADVTLLAEEPYFLRGKNLVVAGRPATRIQTAARAGESRR